MRQEISGNDLRPEVMLDDELHRNREKMQPRSAGPPLRPRPRRTKARRPPPGPATSGPGQGYPRGRGGLATQFSMWVPDDQIVEKTQLVRAETEMASTAVRIYGLVSEVSRRSRRADILEESDRYDNDPGEPSRPAPARRSTCAGPRTGFRIHHCWPPPREDRRSAPEVQPDVPRRAYGMSDAGHRPLRVGLVPQRRSARYGDPARMERLRLPAQRRWAATATSPASPGSQHQVEPADHPASPDPPAHSPTCLPPAPQRHKPAPSY